LRSVRSLFDRNSVDHARNLYLDDGLMGYIRSSVRLFWH
jgi:hypothetical protein